MNIILSDREFYKKMLPLAYTRSIADFRVGVLSIKEKWEKFGINNISVYTQEYLQYKYKLNISDENIVVNACIIPNQQIITAISELDNNETLVKDDYVIAYKTDNKSGNFSLNNLPEKKKSYQFDICFLKDLTSIFLLNGSEIEADYKLITKDRKSESLSSSNTLIGDAGKIFIEKGAKVEASTLNTESGYIYIGKNAEIMEGSNIRAPFAIGEDAVVKMGAKIYGPTTVGNGSKVGGEINNSVFFANSNKAHDGFLGQAVIGEWCNIGADSNNSNLKNNYANVKLWSYEKESFVNTGLQFCGLIMADHSKCGINTMFNTGTVIGVSANIYGSGFPRNFVPSFSWGGFSGVKEYKLDKAVEVMKLVLKRRDKSLCDKEIEMYNHIFNISSKYRNF